jgi:hypothetical protein
MTSQSTFDVKHSSLTNLFALAKITKSHMEVQVRHIFHDLKPEPFRLVSTIFLIQKPKNST